MSERSALIVDNQEERARGIGNLLREFGFAPVFARSGSEAVSAYETDPVYDLVVIRGDINNGLNSLTTAKMIRNSQLAKRPYIIGLGESMDGSEKAIASGMDMFAIQPENRSSMSKRLSNLVVLSAMKG